MIKRYRVSANKAYPDSAHRWQLFSHQYLIGDLYVSEDEAQRIADVLNTGLCNMHKCEKCGEVVPNEQVTFCEGRGLCFTCYQERTKF